MMKLYLCSLRPKVKTDLLKLIDYKTAPSVTIVANAWDVDLKKRGPEELNNCINNFKSFGFTTKVLDLKNANQQSIADQLSNQDLVWVMGGNTFYLNYLMQKSDFKTAVKPLLKTTLAYGGESAGAVVIGKTLHGIEYLDDPKLSPELLWDGLKLIDFSIIPHWDTEKYAEYLQRVKTEMEKYSLATTLKNNQAFIVDGEELEVIEQ